jgi:hypothetical protein
MRTALAIAPSILLAMLGCGDTDDRVAEREPQAPAYESPPPSNPPMVNAPTEPVPDVSTGLPSAESPAATGGSTADLEIMRKIREQLVATENLSSQAQSIEVNAEQGVVTLRGPVGSDAEKEQVLSVARATEGVSRVEDELEVRAP